MPGEEQWLETFSRLGQGSRYEAEAKRLGVGKGTVHRHYTQYLESQVESIRKKRTSLEGAVRGLTEEYKRKKQKEEAKLQSALEPLKAKLAGLGSEYEKRKQEEETKLREALAKRERENKLRVERIDAELEAKKKLLSECARQGMSFKECFETVKKIGDLGTAISQRAEISGQWDKAIFGKRNRHDELGRQIKEKEGRLGELITKLRFAGQLLQHNQVENQQLQEKISRQSAILDQLLNRIKELGDTKTELNAEIQELGKKLSTLDLDKVSLEKRNADLRKTFDADKKTFDADRASLEERNVILRRSNAEMENTLRKSLETEKGIKAQVDAEFAVVREAVARDLEKYIEEGKAIAENEVSAAARESKERCAEELRALQQDCAYMSRRREELRIQSIALAVQIGEATATLELLGRKEEPTRDGKGKRVVYAAA